METAKSLHDALDSQQHTRGVNPTDFNAGYADREQRTCFECRTRNRGATVAGEMCTKDGSAAARRASGER